VLHCWRGRRSSQEFDNSASLTLACLYVRFSLHTVLASCCWIQHTLHSLDCVTTTTTVQPTTATNNIFDATSSRGWLSMSIPLGQARSVPRMPDTSWLRCTPIHSGSHNDNLGIPAAVPSVDYSSTLSDRKTHEICTKLHCAVASRDHLEIIGSKTVKTGQRDELRFAKSSTAALKGGTILVRHVFIVWVLTLPQPGCVSIITTSHESNYD